MQHPCLAFEFVQEKQYWLGNAFTTEHLLAVTLMRRSASGHAAGRARGKRSFVAKFDIPERLASRRGLRFD
jgi:hypothetical protein